MELAVVGFLSNRLVERLDSPEVCDLPAAVQFGRDPACQAEPQLLDVQPRRPGLDLGLRWRGRDLDQELLVCEPENTRVPYRLTACQKE